jgi:hypothetical protein
MLKADRKPIPQVGCVDSPFELDFGMNDMTKESNSLESGRSESDSLIAELGEPTSIEYVVIAFLILLGVLMVAVPMDVAGGSPVPQEESVFQDDGLSPGPFGESSMSDR